MTGLLHWFGDQRERSRRPCHGGCGRAPDLLPGVQSTVPSAIRTTCSSATKFNGPPELIEAVSSSRDVPAGAFFFPSPQLNVTIATGRGFRYCSNCARMRLYKCVRDIRAGDGMRFARDRSAGRRECRPRMSCLHKLDGVLDVHVVVAGADAPAAGVLSDWRRS